ncbi:MAG TPA: SDR family oxidoreductase, partial [Micromonosporaceae bacterium]|nr:SDR family oxidoreductase [Micromonosporaceae bacterium]
MPTAIVTGASRGLGYALTAQLATNGWHIIIDARDAEALGAAAESLRGNGWHPDARVEAVPGDITSADHRADLVAAATAAGGLDLLVNNAGVLGPSPLPSSGSLGGDDLRAIVEVNVLAPLALTQLALPLLRASRGVVIDITSDAAVEAYPGWGGYGAAKAATEQLRNVLAAEEAEASTGVTVWRVDPGDLRTEMHQLAFPGEDISDRPLPEAVAPGLPALLAARPPSGRYRLADYVPAEPAPTGP